jgi:hypothetical protein
VGQGHLCDHVLFQHKVNVGIVIRAELPPEVVIGGLGDGAGQLEKVTVHRISPNKHQEERKNVAGVAPNFNYECSAWEIVWTMEYRVRENTEAMEEVGTPTTQNFNS